jgi:hypothetical protein
MELIWYLTPGRETETVNALKAEGAPIRSGLGFEPLTTIATVLAVTALVQALINLYRDARYTGVVIDATSDPIEIREMPGWSRKEVLVITTKGATFHSASADESAAGELRKIAELLGKD